ncbi:hypothetical protein MaudMau93_007915 [Microsporum audouinii]
MDCVAGRLISGSPVEGCTVKNLRLTCSVIRNAARLDLDRVFLSIHKRDTEVFRSIASHEIMRLQVKETIWDDGAFSPSPVEDVVERKGEYFGKSNGLLYDKVPKERCPGESPKYCPKWFSQACDGNLEGLAGCKFDLRNEAGLIERMMEPHPLMLPWESWERYKKYL